MLNVDYEGCPPLYFGHKPDARFCQAFPPADKKPEIIPSQRSTVYRHTLPLRQFFLQHLNPLTGSSAHILMSRRTGAPNGGFERDSPTGPPDGSTFLASGVRVQLIPRMLTCFSGQEKQKMLLATDTGHFSMIK